MLVTPVERAVSSVLRLHCHELNRLVGGSLTCCFLLGLVVIRRYWRGSCRFSITSFHCCNDASEMPVVRLSATDWATHSVFAVQQVFLLLPHRFVFCNCASNLQAANSAILTWNMPRER